MLVAPEEGSVFPFFLKLCVLKFRLELKHKDNLGEHDSMNSDKIHACFSVSAQPVSEACSILAC